jgi:DNA-binding NtrC family response regulator
LGLDASAASASSSRVSSLPRPSADAERAPSAEERQEIETALVRAHGVVSRAAAELGVSRQALYRRMERLGIELERRPKAL